jgi:hypothetical protein
MYSDMLAYGDRFTQRADLARSGRVRQIACKLLRQIICKVTKALHRNRLTESDERTQGDDRESGNRGMDQEMGEGVVRTVTVRDGQIVRSRKGR